MAEAMEEAGAGVEGSRFGGFGPSGENGPAGGGGLKDVGPVNCVEVGFGCGPDVGSIADGFGSAADGPSIG